MPSSAKGIYIDAHCHLHDERLKEVLSSQSGELEQPRIAAHVINGTHPDDWGKVDGCPGFNGSRALKAYGVHPWYVSGLPDDWQEQLREWLATGAACVGEIGLDNWIEPRNETLQKEVFIKQLMMACERNLPVTIHCVRAWGSVLDCLRSHNPPRGFLMHGYGGSVEMMHDLAVSGGYFSFSAYAAHPGRNRIREVIRKCPADRLLVETDAPDMLPPDNVLRYPLVDESGSSLHHPSEIVTAYECIAEWRNISVEELAQQVESNFECLFGG